MCPSSTTTPRSALDELAELAAVLCNADYAYVGWMDANRLWFKSRFGFRAAEQPRSTTACQWMIEKGEPLLISDAGRDLRFPPDGIPLSGAEPCLSYAAVPLVSSDEQIIGTLAVLARGRERFHADHLSLLDDAGVARRLRVWNSTSAFVCRSNAQRLQPARRPQRWPSNAAL